MPLPVDAVKELNDILHDLEPAFEFGLGWIGFVVGLELDVRTLDKIPASTASGPIPTKVPSPEIGPSDTCLLPSTPAMQTMPP